MYQNYVKPFEEFEVSGYDFPADFITTEQQKKLTELLAVLEGIEHFEKKKLMLIDNINSFPGTFSELRAKYVDEIDTINRCIVRLHTRYERIKAEL